MSSPKKKPAKRGRPKKKVKEMSQTHGKVDSFTPTSLDQIWGDDGTGRYSTMVAEEYMDSVRNMSMTDLQAHASKIGFIPIDNRENLEKRLIKEFKRHVSEFRAPKDVGITPESEKISAKAKKILEEGR